MAGETLSERRLNRALLARQHLLGRSSDELPALLEGIGGLQTQYAPSAYVGAWTRVAGFERTTLTRALEKRAVIQATMMRVTIHMVSAADYWPLTAAIRRSRRAWLSRVARAEFAGVDMEAVANAVRDELAIGPLRMEELTARLVARGFAPQAVKWAGLWVDLVRVPPSGTWERRRADLYGLAEQWLPPPRAWSEAEGVELLVRRYLEGFGPARPAEIADWGGVPVALLGPALEAVAVRRFRDESGRELVDLPGESLPAEDTPAPLRFLPTWDATLLAHARRTQILPEPYRARIFSTKTPHSVGTFLVDGRVAGTWRHDQGRIVSQPFEPLTAHVRRQLEDEAERLAAFLA